ncbi:class I SAM-dependent methyltransferase EftM [Pseudomonas aeruginosa]|uniref:class I SAM-dependent methyltransferase EftM n=1 Tax=Pseudomonas aeruginosa TaxID=287 RepID=UPI0007175A6C|nr:class I SAM-dependent methyltransferase EftM [Pseudomonas aeruginosa]KRU92409.1 SAM-dependent methyltransferase [Pseudomonas aeruginosa]KRV00418.1 SAM-dependent methyltransferase [Pseudomonas aeruginosa]MBG4398995.1 class I SAM-dependent methyltransferase EftM [Pseudomonas aeruginosa]MBO2831909.1 class I SAM-dependent methyltransferase EftM [Pseudomonas aeruginosa]MBU5956138.1 class I SAM-dependent methyltransferase EftM [Pseudomonas aeruginosa]
MSSNALYTDLSAYYDLMCADIDYQAQSHCVRRLHQLFGNQGQRHLDLACGTGPHVRHFLDFGYRSAGLDINQPMLDLARQRCPEAHFSRQDMAGFQVDEPLDLITCFLYSIHYNAGLERLRACLASVHGALADGGVFCFNTVDKSRIDNRSFVRHSVEHQGSRFTFGSGWYYSGEGERQALRLGIEKTTDGTTQTWEDEHAMVALGFAELQHLLQAHFEVQVFEHDYERITPWAGSSGNALFVCVKR